MSAVMTRCCNCCNLEVDRDNLDATPIWQAWLWCIVATVIWVVWMRFLSRMQDRVAADVNVRNVTAADFSVWMSNLPEEADNDFQLRQFAEHYGQVVAAFHIRTLGNVLNLNNKVEVAERKLAELKALAEHPGGFLDMLYRKSIHGVFSGLEAAQESLEVLICIFCCMLCVLMFFTAWWQSNI